MNPIALLLALPLAGALVLALVSDGRLGARLNIGACALTFMATLLVVLDPPAAGAFGRIDGLNAVILALNGFVVVTTSIFSARYVVHEAATGRLAGLRLRLYHALYQVLVFAMMLALVTDNLGVMWVAIEIATLTTVVVVGLYRTPEAIEAAWKYFMLGSVGIALALFGTILLYVAAQPVVGEGADGMAWSVLREKVAGFDPGLVNLAFVFLLLGYGTKVGLSPLNAWLPDAHAEGPTPVSAVLSGLLLNVALYAVLRVKMLVAAHPEALAPGPLMMAAGLASLLMAGVMLYRRRDIKRLFAYSSIEHMGIMVLAFGIGGPLANFAGLLHMAMHTLTKSAIYFGVGAAAQIKGTQKLADITGLTASHPALGWALVAGGAGIMGLPPAGIFMSEFLLVTSSFAAMPALTLALVAGLLLAFGALAGKIAGIAFGPPSPDAGLAAAPVKVAIGPMVLHLALVFIAGVWLPPALADLLRQVAVMLG